MKPSINIRTIIIDGHKTSVSLEDAFWQGLRDIAKRRGETLSCLVGSIDANRQHANLSSAIRLFVLGVYCKSDPQGRARASLAA
jgi:predicted DNA-binding ribbon-helix-helix protein